jgi:hypothetical protein
LREGPSPVRAVPRPRNIERDRRVGTHDEIREALTGARREEATDVTHTLHAVHLYSRPHIDLQRVAGALCPS